MFSDKQLKKILTTAEVVSEKDFDAYAKEAKKLGKRTENFLIEKNIAKKLKLQTPSMIFHTLKLLRQYPNLLIFTIASHFHTQLKRLIHYSRFRNLEIRQY